MSEYPLYLRNVTPYEFFRYHQAGEFYDISTALQARQIGALDRVASTLAGQNYYLAAQVDATSRVVSAVEAQSPLLRDISSAVREGTFVIGSQLSDINRHMGSIEGLMADNLFLQEVQTGLLEDIKASGQQRNLLLRQGNDLSKIIVKLLARQNDIDPSDIAPEYFPKPPIPKPLTIPERIRAARAKEDYALHLLARYSGVFGQERVEAALVRYIQVPDQELAQLNPSGFADGMIADAYKKGRTATNDLSTAVNEYDFQLNLIESTVTKTIKDSRAKALLEGVKREVWKGAGGVVSPIVVDINYGEIPEKDREVIAGWKLETPPRYKPANMSELALSVHFPVWLTYTPEDEKTATSTDSEMLILDGDPPDGIPFPDTLNEGLWRESSYKFNGRKHRRLQLFFDIFPDNLEVWIWVPVGSRKNPHVSNKGFFNIAFAKDVGDLADLPAAIRESQAARISRGELPQALNEASDARLAADRQTSETLNQKLQVNTAELIKLQSETVPRLRELQGQIDQAHSKLRGLKPPTPRENVSFLKEVILGPEWADEQDRAAQRIYENERQKRYELWSDLKKKYEELEKDLETQRHRREVEDTRTSEVLKPLRDHINEYIQRLAVFVLTHPTPALRKKLASLKRATSETSSNLSHISSLSGALRMPMAGIKFPKYP